MVSILWTATVTPFEVAFIAQGPGSSRIWLLYALNRMIDAVFVVDILLSFFIPFRQPAKQCASGGGWVYSNGAIARRYLRSWFALDVATAIPFEVIMESTAIDPTSFVAKCLKVLRLFKLARLVRLRRILQRWLARSTIDLSVLELIKFAVMTVVMAHWLACMWGFAGRHYSDNTPSTSTSGTSKTIVR